MADTELKACPFCGATELERNDSNFWTGRENTTTRYRIQHHCKDVEGRVYRSIEVAGTTEAEMISAWQARARDSRCGELLEAAKELVTDPIYGTTSITVSVDEFTRLRKAIAAFEASHEK